MVLQEVSDTRLEGVAGGSTQLKNDIQRGLEALRRSLVHHVGFESQLEGRGYGRSVSAKSLDARVVVLCVTVLTSRPVASHYAHRGPPLDH